MNINRGAAGKKGSVKRILRLGLSACLLLVIAVNIFPGSAAAAAQWYDSAWKFRKQITIDYTLVAHDLAGFPVLISLAEDKDLSANALKNADDLLFTDADGITKFSHEIEYYDCTTGQLQAWVNVKYLSAEKETVIFMYYGNESATSQQSPKSVWDKYFSLVQHLEETSGTEYDSTANGNDGVYTGTGQDASGKIDGADKFNGTSNNVKIPHATVLTFTTDYTLETWVNLATLSQWTRHIISKNGEYYLQFNNNKFVFFVNGPGELTSTTSPVAGTWVHVAAVFHRGAASWGPHTMEIYINGVLDASVTGGGTPANTVNSLYLGSSATGNYLNGSLDEVRISSTARPKEWLQTAYNNQSKPEAFYKVGAEETPIVAPAVTTNAASSVEETTATLNGMLNYDGGEPCQYRFEYDIDSGAPYAFSTAWTGSITSGQAFSAAISGLSKGTKYYFRAQARNSAGTISGGQLSLLTRPEGPAPGSFTVTVVSGTQVDLSWTKGEGSQKTMVRAKEGGYPESVTDGREVYFDTGTSVSDTGLIPGTTYYYRAWSYVSGSEQWSDTYVEASVTTSSTSTVSVGGTVYRVDKFGILLPWLGLSAVLIITAIAGITLCRKLSVSRFE